MANDAPWLIRIDTGGTFTDCLARDPSGRVHRAKVLSSGALRGVAHERRGDRALLVAHRWGHLDVTGCRLRFLGDAEGAWSVCRHDPSHGLIEVDGDLPPVVLPRPVEVSSGEPAPLLAARLVTGTPARQPLPPLDLRLATTWGTNALLERRGAPTALFITEGLRDLLAIGDQQRPDLFALRIVREHAPYAAVVEVRERLAANGAVVRPLDLEHAAAAARHAREAGIETAAVALLHGYVDPDHERRLAGLLREQGFRHVSCSAELAPLIRLLPRAETAVVDAYLAPVIGAHLDELRRRMPRGRRHVMTSAGGLVDASRFRPKDSLLSGPAGGVAGAAAAGRRVGEARIIGFDMGGTSTDVARYDGDFEYRFRHEVGGARLLAPALAIETVAAGGGSICSFRDERLRVGPQSAGADPGPACYGAGGPLTLTDVNLLLGRIDDARFEIPIDAGAARAALQRLRDSMGAAAPAAEALLEGLLEVADERMAAAIARVSLRQGYDPEEYALVAFGGAGGQHACAVAERLGIRVVVMPEDASLLSAVGLSHAVIERFAQRQVLRRLDEVEREIEGWLEELAARACGEVAAEGVPVGRVAVRRRLVALRLLGQDATLAIEAGPTTALRDRFAARYESIYGQPPGGTPIEVESIRVVASAEPADDDFGPEPAPGPIDAGSPRSARAWIDGAWRDLPEVDRAALETGARLAGPAIVLDARTSFLLAPGWRAEARPGGLVARRGADHARVTVTRPEIVEQELFTNRLEQIAEEMGQMLERTALSTNVKERLDFSCTLLDPEGGLVVNAPHMPVHLGAMGLCVRALRDAIEMGPGDVVVTNHPAYGGSHLPDVTVVTPVHVGDGAALIGYVASRAHHAEIGGTRPGSMPPDARSLLEEGVLIRPSHLVRGGVDRLDAVAALLRAGPHPSRAVDDNLADLRAQVAANHRGATALRELARLWGRDRVVARMNELTGRAERLARGALAELPDGGYDAEERLDDGAPLRVAIAIDGDRAVIDFTGSAPQHAGNLNATPAIVRSAVIYVLRLLIGERLPLNEGIMRAVDVVIPPGILSPDFSGDDPAAWPAVVGGNVETSQRLVDTLLKALRLCACSQGTMNNTLFGTERFGYYETVCGGSGAGPGFDGADGVHTHMTNTRITDPEVLEQRYPVRIERFELRRGSGGAGRHRGGDGVVREIRFLAPMQLSVLGQHRREGPYGMDGGEPGSAGRQRVVTAGGTEITLGSVDGRDVDVGDRLILETPGGGGWG